MAGVFGFDAAGYSRLVSPWDSVSVLANGPAMLPSEPQEGPVEYKLHLLLRTRRSFTRSTNHFGTIPGQASRAAVDAGRSDQVRADRLQHLTTQMLWRLQESNPASYVARSHRVIRPVLPARPGLSHALPGWNCTKSSPFWRLARLVPGLEQCPGALYELGVANDGTLVGLAEDEMDDSLAMLIAMASSLGCVVVVRRKVEVGECEWTDEDGDDGATSNSSILWAVEALVRPPAPGRDQYEVVDPDGAEHARLVLADGLSEHTIARPLDQVRVSFVGATTSGKTTLLGTLSFGQHDDGRGKARLGLMTHRHEIESGMTSSVTHQLLSYRWAVDPAFPSNRVVEAVGPKDSVPEERLKTVLFTDLAGHPSYRRTAIGGLIGWASHWTVMCIAATCNLLSSTSESTSSYPSSTGQSDRSADLESQTKSYLNLCLRLGLPLVVAITKYDYADKDFLKMNVLAPLLTCLKNAGRKPALVRPAGSASNLSQIPADKFEQLQATFRPLLAYDDSESTAAVVPILFTSAKDGTGIHELHSLLCQLPPVMPGCLATPLSPATATTAAAAEPATSFHIETIYNLSSDMQSQGGGPDSDLSPSAVVVVAGLLRRGSLWVGQTVMVGPFSICPITHRFDRRRQKPTPLSLASAPSLGPTADSEADAAKTFWHVVRVVSLRMNNEPVSELLAKQVGTVGLVGLVSAGVVGSAGAGSIQRDFVADIRYLRKGMVLLPSPDRPAGPQDSNDSHTRRDSAIGSVGRSITVRFVAPQDILDANSLLVSSGSSVYIFTKSVRAACRVISRRDVVTEPVDPTVDLVPVDVQFEFVSSTEHVDVGSQVLVLPNQTLNGLVGWVVDV